MRWQIVVYKFGAMSSLSKKVIARRMILTHWVRDLVSGLPRFEKPDIFHNRFDAVLQTSGFSGFSPPHQPVYQRTICSPKTRAITVRIYCLNFYILLTSGFQL